MPVATRRPLGRERAVPEVEEEDGAATVEEEEEEAEVEAEAEEEKGMHAGAFRKRRRAGEGTRAGRAGREGRKGVPAEHLPGRGPPCQGQEPRRRLQR